jgi:hypothetical protein
MAQIKCLRAPSRDPQAESHSNQSLACLPLRSQTQRGIHKLSSYKRLQASLWQDEQAHGGIWLRAASVPQMPVSAVYQQPPL